MTTLSLPPRTARITDDPLRRRVPPLGGFNLTMLGIELRRMLRNRRTMIFSLVFPAAMLLVISSSDDTWDAPVADGNEAAYILISVALYGASMIAAVGGSSVAIERALGWSRQLRVTPLKPVAYVAAKAVVALALGALAVTAVYVAGVIQGRAAMPATTWVASAVVTLLCAYIFAALGLFIGYLVPGENAMQIIGPGLAVLAFLGGVFFPISEGTMLWHVAVLTPMFGVAEIARAPLTHDLSWYAVVNAIVWLGLFVAGAAWRMSKDTARV